MNRKTLRRLWREIAQRKQVEAELKESEARYRAIVEDQTEFVCRFKPDGTLTFVNKAFCRYFDVSPQSVLGQNFLHIVSDKDRTVVNDYLKSLDSDNPVGSVEGRVVLDNGETPWQRWIFRLIFGEQAQLQEIQAVGRDITERKLAAEALHKSVVFNQAVMNSLTEQIVVLDEAGKITATNDAWKKFSHESGVLGQDKIGIGDDLLSACRQAEEKGNPASQAALAGIQAVLNGTQSHFSLEYARYSKEEKRWFIMRVTPLRVKEKGAVVAHIEITTLKQMEEVLRQKSAELEAIFMTIPDAVVFANTNRQIVNINPAFTALFGFDLEDVVGKQTEVLYENIQDYHLQGKIRYHLSAEEKLKPYEVVYCRKNGTLFVSETTGTLVKDAEGQPLGYMAIIRDITDQKRAERERAQLFEAISQQREQLRTLAGRLAEAQDVERKALARELHDQVGQNLTALDLNLNIIQGQLSSNSYPVNDTLQSRLVDSLALVAEMGERIRNVMSNLRPPVLDDYGLVAALRWYADRFSPRFGFTTVVEEENSVPRLDEPVENALFRIAQEALTNVAKHAQASQVVVRVEADAEFVQLTISDNGIGFDLADWARPSTRNSWGLITIIERAEAIGGNCQIESQPGRGTKLIVVVPW